MNVEKLTKLINRKYPNYDIKDTPLQLFYNKIGDFVAHYEFVNVDIGDFTNVIFVGQGSTVFMDYLFEKPYDAVEYFKDNVRVLL